MENFTHITHPNPAYKDLKVDKFVENLNKAMADAGVNTPRLAELIGEEVASYDTVLRWTKGEQSPRLDQVGAVCKALGVDCFHLLGQPTAPQLSEAEDALLRIGRYHGYEVAYDLLYRAIKHPGGVDPRNHGRRKES
jgi:transcriptional regulator with XRE-family HTH domain